MYVNKKMITREYFKVLFETDDYIEVMSNNTGHCWVIKQCKSKNDYPFILFHKHSISTQYYHKHWQTISFNQAVRSIKSHDDYVLFKKQSV